MRVRGFSTQTLYLFRRTADFYRDWRLAKACTDELARRGEFGERRAA